MTHKVIDDGIIVAKFEHCNDVAEFLFDYLQQAISIDTILQKLATSWPITQVTPTLFVKSKQ